MLRSTTGASDADCQSRCLASSECTFAIYTTSGQCVLKKDFLNGR